MEESSKKSSMERLRKRDGGRLRERERERDKERGGWRERGGEFDYVIPSAQFHGGRGSAKTKSIRLRVKTHALNNSLDSVFATQG